MRRCISLGLIVGLLVVSGAPLVSAAEICGPASGTQYASRAVHNPESAHSPSQAAMQMHDAQYGPVLGLSFDTCRLECGCGCHDSVDSLPHLLAPHAVCLPACENLRAEKAAIVLPLADFVAHAPTVSTPPPRNA